MFFYIENTIIFLVLDRSYKISLFQKYKAKEYGVFDFVFHGLHSLYSTGSYSSFLCSSGAEVNQSQPNNGFYRLVQY